MQLLKTKKPCLLKSDIPHQADSHRSCQGAYARITGFNNCSGTLSSPFLLRKLRQSITAIKLLLWGVRMEQGLSYHCVVPFPAPPPPRILDHLQSPTDALCTSAGLEVSKTWVHVARFPCPRIRGGKGCLLSKFSW